MIPTGEGRAPEGKSPPAFNVPPVTLWTACFLVGAFLALRFGSEDWTRWMLENLAFSTDAFAAALAAGALGPGVLLPLVSHSALHFDLLHLLLNVGLLVAFGSLVERVHGAIWFALLFVACAAVGALVQFAVLGGQPSTMIGASGAVYGMIGATVPLMFWSRAGYGWHKGLGFIAVIMLLNIILGPLSTSFDLFGAPIAWEAHIGGFFLGLVLGILLLLRKRRHMRPR